MTPPPEDRPAGGTVIGNADYELGLSAFSIEAFMKNSLGVIYDLRPSDSGACLLVPDMSVCLRIGITFPFRGI